MSTPTRPRRRTALAWFPVAAFASFAAFAALAGLAGLADAAPPTPPPAPLVESVEVEVVEVQVFVTDRDGNPVSGLGAADFRLRVDGEERAIGNFFEAQGAAGAAGAAAAVAAAPGPAEEGNLEPATSPPPARRLSLVVLLDELHLDPRQRSRTLSRLEPLLRERLDAGDALMLASLDRSLRVLRPFDGTADLAADLAAIARRAPGGIGTEAHRRNTVAQIRDIHGTSGCEGEALALMQALAAAWTQTVEAETRQTLDSLREVLRTLAGREGSKAMLLVTSGLPLDPGLEVRLLLDELCQTGRGGPQTGLAQVLAEVTRAANAAQVTFYSLDAGGQRVLASALDAGGGMSLASQSEVRGNLQDPVFSIATDTGGRALLESNRPELLLTQLARDFSSYYSLGFTPLPGDASRAHRVDVEVRRPGLRTRHRTSWLPLSADERLSAALLGRLRFGGSEDNPLGARLEVGTPRRESDGSYTVSLRLSVPAAGLALVPTGDRRRGSLGIFLAVGDREGRTTPVRSSPLPVDLPAGEGGEATLQLQLRVAAGESRVAMAVRDELAQQTALLSRRVQAGPAR